MTENLNEELNKGSGNVNSCAESGNVNPCAESGNVNSCAESGNVNPCAESGNVNSCTDSGNVNPYAEGIDHVALSADGKSVTILDQTQLPCREVYKDVRTPEECYDAIKKLEVRGAPCIGIFAGYAMTVIAQQHADLEGVHFTEEMHKVSEYLNSSRPTAVNLSWALARMENVISGHIGEGVPAVLALMKEESLKIHQEDIEMCRKIAEYGLTLVKDGDGILTHCNAGPLATSKFGTALGPILLGQEKGLHFHVFSDETRPLLQGARLTSFELAKAGVDVTLICDNMASIVMKNGWVQACFVGCDRVAANGDFANKIGTSGVAILAKHYGIPFYTLGPTSTIDMNCPTGDDIKIELRDPEEIKKMWYREPMALPEVKCYNPSFDVTDHSLLTAIVTDRGIVYPPFDVNLKKLFS
ncbi:MAG TPA: S-methyl-5-thioribose-1-phosphate isomerase [Lachnospiraceae bacterium]|nr:S-methyl-5-thioribose-1-phosphate isomerase [Lachnospiraceae bacterium]